MPSNRLGPANSSRKNWNAPLNRERREVTDNGSQVLRGPRPQDVHPGPRVPIDVEFILGETRTRENVKGNHRAIAEHGLILRVTVGSTLHGLNVDEQDDRDEMGICVPPPECVLGLVHFEHYVERTKPQGIRSGPGDLDYTCYSLQKWCRLALNGNPTVLLPLFAPDPFVLHNTTFGEELREHAHWFASKRAGNAFLGYLRQQRGRLTGDRGQKRCNRPELIQRYGFDLKYAGCVIRLGCQGNEYLRTGRLTLPMREPEREMIRSIRRGEVNLSDVLIMAAELEESLRKEIASTSLPTEPNYDAVNAWLVDTHQSFWDRKPFPVQAE